MKNDSTFSNGWGRQSAHKYNKIAMPLKTENFTFGPQREKMYLRTIF